MSFVTNIVWGKKPVKSRQEFKYAMLRGEFALIIATVGIFYSILDSSNGVVVFLPLYAIMIAMSGLSIILNRYRYYTTATILILIVINFLIYLFADVDHPNGGVFFYFMTSTMAGLILLSYYQSRLGLLFAFLPVAMGYLAYFTDINLIPVPVYEANMITINFIANFTISLFATVFMLQFLLNRNNESEQSLVRQNELLEKANKELDHFVYSVSHDLRAPLSSILGLTNVYHLSNDDSERAEMVKMIHERALSLDKFIREVLDYSRNARVELRLQTINVKELIGEVVQSLLFIQGKEEIEINMSIDSSLEVSSDRERMKVVLSNIIGNAFYYRDPAKKSRIEIRSLIENGQWVITIKDNGLGIKKEHVGRIFEMFYKAHDRAQGTGLGLYIVKETLQRLNGEIDVESEYGVGTTFTMTLRP
jgi:signal transduction histidine kinase